MPPKRITIHDVAKTAGVSIGAVSRILSNDPKLNVRDETRELVHRTIAALGYSPNPQAKALRLSRSGTIAFIVPEIYSPAFPATVKGAQRAAQVRGYSLLLAGLGEDGEDPNLTGQLLTRNGVDGVLVSTGKEEESVLSVLKKIKAPVVLLNRFIDDEFPHVILDDSGGAAALVNHLLSLGHKRVGYLGALDQHLGSRRIDGLQVAFDAAGIDFDPALTIATGYDRAEGERGFDELMGIPNPPTAVITTNHVVAAGVMIAARRRGYSVPGDISVASFYDSQIAELLNPPLTSVEFPLEDLGFRAATMLIDLIEGTPLSIKSALIDYSGVVVRGSTSTKR